MGYTCCVKSSSPMQKNRIILIFIGLIAVITVKAQDAAIIRTYIETYRSLAIAEMQRTGVPASIKLAQGIHETMAGTSDLVKKSNNHFGIKCKSNWTGESVSHDDDARGECFRKYEQAADSYKDHSDFLKNSSRYATLFKLDPLDYSAWAYGLKKAGYATNPKYPQIIIRLIEDYHLQDYTLIAMGKMQTPAEWASVASIESNNKATIIPAAGIIQEEPIKKQVPNYPLGEFKINDTRVVFVKKETPLLAIAQQYNVSLSRLLEFNEIPEMETLGEDQLIYLQRKKKTGQNEFHVVKTGETVQEIARDEAIRLESLLAYNHLQSQGQQPAVGEQLYLRRTAPIMPKLVKKETVVE